MAGRNRKIGWKMRYAMISLAVMVAIAASGCASKGYVNKRIDPVGQRVGTLETASAEQGEKLEAVRNDADRANERALSAGERADGAANAAERANQEAQKADRRAGEAMNVAETAVNGLDSLEERVDGLNEYSLVSEASILFGFESSKLADEARKKLDEISEVLLLDSPYAVEVRGFTDKTGGSRYNLALSERRADTVVRYLMTTHNIPLHRIHKIGLGSDDPAADNKSREGRKQNRRVEVRIYVADREAISALLH
jgi:OmpA-OmpF porin, OOP family